MDEIFLYLVGIALVVGFFTCTIVLPIVAFARSRRFTDVSERLDRLEREMQRLHDRPVVAAADQSGAAEEAPASATPRTEEAHATTVGAQPAPRRMLFWPRVQEGFDLEAWIGQHGLGWVAVILLLFATAFFLRYAFENEWVGELGRVAIGVLGGVGLCLAGLRFHRRGWRVFSQMLSAGGVVLLYLATFGAFGYYRLLPQSQAGLFLVVLIAETAALAVLYEAPAIALMALIGGLLNPVLLSTGHDQYRSLFTYLALLDAGVVGLALFRNWRALGTVALVGTQVLFWGWYDRHFHPDKLAAAVGFQAVVFGLFLVHGVLAHVVRPNKATPEDLARLTLNAFLFGGALYILLDEDYHKWMGTLALALAFVYTLLGWLVLRSRPDDERQSLVVVAVALGFVAMVFPLQAEATWITVGWAVEGLALWWFGLRVRARGLRGLGAALLILAVARLLFVDTPGMRHRELFIPFFNEYGLPASVVAACVLLAAGAARRFLPRLERLDHTVLRLALLGGAGLVWMILSIETYDFYYMYFQRYFPPHARLAAQTALSVVWAAYAAFLLGLGFRLHNPPIRWTALGLFALTLGKVVFVDMAELPGFFRVAVFLALALMMAAAAWGYQKFQLGRLTDKGDVPHDPIR